MKEIIKMPTSKIIIYVAILGCILLSSCDHYIGIGPDPQLAQYQCKRYGNGMIDQYDIVVPLNWSTLSTDSSKPELIVAWRDTVNNTVHIKWDN